MPKFLNPNHSMVPTITTHTADNYHHLQHGIPWYTVLNFMVYHPNHSMVPNITTHTAHVYHHLQHGIPWYTIHMLLRTTYRTTYGHVPQILPCLPWYTYYKIVVYLSSISCITTSYSNRGAVQKQFAHHTLNEVSLYKKHNKDLVYQISLHGIPTAKCAEESGIHIYF